MSAEPYREPPEAGIGGEGPIVDWTGEAATTDATIEEAVRSALLLDPEIDAEHFTVSVENGVVRLNGPRSSLAERRRAIEVAETVANVRRVLDVTEGHAAA